MIEHLWIDSLRGVRQGEVGGLSPLSVLVGPNNCGKSTCLEALAIVGLGEHAAAIVKALLQRGGPPLDAIEHIVTRDQPDAKLIVRNGSQYYASRVGPPRARDRDRFDEARKQGIKERSTQFDVLCATGDSAAAATSRLTRTLADSHGTTFVDEDGQVALTFSSNPSGWRWATHLRGLGHVGAHGQLEDAHNELFAARAVPRVVKALRPSFPGLVDLQVSKRGEDFVLHTVTEGDDPPVPAYLAGDGLKRLLSLAASTYAVKGGVALMEEPEAYQHPRYLNELVDILLDAAATDTQVILSTHSLELLDTLLSRTKSDAFPTIHRLRLAEGVLSSTTVLPAEARMLREELAQDLRS